MKSGRHPGQNYDVCVYAFNHACMLAGMYAILALLNPYFISIVSDQGD